MRMSIYQCENVYVGVLNMVRVATFKYPTTIMRSGDRQVLVEFKLILVQHNPSLGPNSLLFVAVEESDRLKVTTNRMFQCKLSSASSVDYFASSELYQERQIDQIPIEIGSTFCLIPSVYCFPSKNRFQ